MLEGKDQRMVLNISKWRSILKKGKFGGERMALLSVSHPLDNLAKAWAFAVH